jgi:hypothetical protein
MRRIRGRTLLAAAVTVAVTTGVGYAAIPSSNGAVNGCYERITGILRVIDTDAGKRCKSFETPLAWNVQGPSGAPGATGPKGDTGAKGEQGDPGAPGPTYSAGSGLELAGTEFRLGFDPATQAELDAANAARAALQQQVGQLATQGQQQASHIAELQSDVAALESALAALRAQVGQLTAGISVTGSSVSLDRPLVVQGTVRAHAFLTP